MMTFYVGICVMLFGGGAFIAFFTRLLISLFANEPVNPEKIMLFSIVWATIIAVGAILTVIGHFLKKKEALAAATASDAPTAADTVEDNAAAVDAPVEDNAAVESEAETEDEATVSEPTEDAAEQPTEEI